MQSMVQICAQSVCFNDGVSLWFLLIDFSDVGVGAISVGIRSRALDGLKALVEKFPTAESTTMFEGVAKKIELLHEGIDKEDKDAKAAIMYATRSYFDELTEKVKEFEEKEILPVLRKLITSMDFSTIPADLQSTAERIYGALPMFNKAHQLFDGELLPPAYLDKRSVSEDVKGLLTIPAKVQEAIAGEFFDNTLATSCVTLASRIDPDRFRPAFGDGFDVTTFVEEFGKSEVVKKCKEMNTKLILPVMQASKAKVRTITSFTKFKPEEEQIKQLEELQLEALDKELNEIEQFAGPNRDVKLSAQVAQFKNVKGLVGTMIQALKWQRDATKHDLSDGSVSCVSNVRQAFRKARIQIAEFPLIFKAEGDIAHTNEFDEDSFVEELKGCIGGVADWLTAVTEKWKDDMKKLSEAIDKMMPSYTHDTLLDEDVVKALLTTPHFSALGSSANELYKMMDVALFRLFCRRRNLDVQM